MSNEIKQLAVYYRQRPQFTGTRCHDDYRPEPVLDDPDDVKLGPQYCADCIDGYHGDLNIEETCDCDCHSEGEGQD